MTRQIKLGSNVQVVIDKDSGMLIGRKGNVKSISMSPDNVEYIWVKFDNHNIPLPFARNELKVTNKKRD